MSATAVKPLAHDPMATPEPEPSVAWSVSDPAWGTPRHGMRAQIVHRVELVRHGETTSNKVLTENGDTTFAPDSTLTEWGEGQSTNVGRFYRRMTAGIELPPNLRIEISPFRRAIATSLPTQRVFAGAPVESYPELREYSPEASSWLQSHDTDGNPTPLRWLRAAETYLDFRSRVETVLARWKARGTRSERAHTIAFTHSQFISAVLTHLIPLASHEDEPPQFFHIPNGSITVLDFDTEGRMHVHCVGYTEHLRQPTGQHTAHVDIYPKTHLSGPWSRGQSSGWTPTSLKPKPAARSPDAYVPPHLRLGATPP